MHVVLEHMPSEHWPRPDGWTVVGRVGPRALAYDPDRHPHLLGGGEPESLDRDAVNAALAPAVDAAASRLWPGGWHVAFSQVFGVHRRSLSAERLARQGLPPGVLQALAYAAGDEDAEAHGALLLALAGYADAWGQGPNPGDRIDQAVEAARSAAAVLKMARKGKPARQDRDTVP